MFVLRLEKCKPTFILEVDRLSNQHKIIKFIDKSHIEAAYYDGTNYFWNTILNKTYPDVKYVELTPEQMMEYL